MKKISIKSVVIVLVLVLVALVLPTKSQSISDSDLYTYPTLGKNYEQLIDPTNLNAPPKPQLTEAIESVYEGEKLSFNFPKKDLDGDWILYHWTSNMGTFTTADPMRFSEVVWQAPMVDRDVQAGIKIWAGDYRGGLVSATYSFIVKNRSSGSDEPSNSGSGNPSPDLVNFSVADPRVSTDQFPQVKASFQLKESGNLVTDLLPRHFTIVENGIYNKSPLVVLPPKSTSNQIDLFLLLDLTGNTKKYQQSIRSNIKSLIDYMRQSGVDLKIYLSTFSSDDKDTDASVKSFLGSDETIKEYVELLPFHQNRVSRAHALGKLFYFMYQSDSSRASAEKIALLVNGSNFYTNEEKKSIQFSLKDLISKFKENNFSLFVIGHPLKQMYRLNTNKAEVGGLSESLPGGYLGFFNTDLTVIYDLLKERTADRYSVLFHSDYDSPNEANGRMFEMGALNYLLVSHQYGGLIEKAPEAIALPLREEDNHYEVEVEVNSNGAFINAVEILYFKNDGSYHRDFMRHIRHKDSASGYRYGISIPSDQMEKKFQYVLKIYTPFDEVELNSSKMDIAQIAFDEGIDLTYQLSTNSGQKEVIWKWSGSTVDKGDAYELWSGDYLLKSIKDKSIRHYTESVTDCSLYKMAKLRVDLPLGVDHERAGDFSYFSRPAEVFVGTDQLMTEQEALNLILKCLKNKKLNTVSEITALHSEPYYPDRVISLNKAAAYMILAMDSDVYKLTRKDRFSAMMRHLKYLSADEFAKYYDQNNPIGTLILHKLITYMNQSKDFSEDYSDMINDLNNVNRGDAGL